MKTIEKSYELATNGKTLRVSLVGLLRALGQEGQVTGGEVPAEVLDALSVKLVRPGVGGAVSLTTDTTKDNYYTVDGSMLEIVVNYLPGGVSYLTVGVQYGTNISTLLTCELHTPDAIVYLQGTSPDEYAITMPLRRCPEKDGMRDGVQFYGFVYVVAQESAWLPVERPAVMGAIAAYYVADLDATIDDADFMPDAVLVRNLPVSFQDVTEEIDLPAVDTFSGVGGGDYKTDVYMDGDGRVILERLDDGSTVLLDEHENPIAKREANGTTKFFDAYQGERFTIDANGNIHFAEFGALATQVASNTQAIQGIAATGGASVASSVLFDDGENAEVKVAKKTEKVRVDIVPVGQSYEFHKGTAVLNFQQLNSMLQTSPDFVVFVHNSREHRCVEIVTEGNPKSMTFLAPTIEGVNVKAQSFRVESTDGVAISAVKRTDIICENKTDADALRDKVSGISEENTELRISQGVRKRGYINQAGGISGQTGKATYQEFTLPFPIASLRLKGVAIGGSASTIAFYASEQVDATKFIGNKIFTGEVDAIVEVPTNTRCITLDSWEGYSKLSADQIVPAAVDTNGMESLGAPIDFAGKKIAAFGDSITYGVCSPMSQGIDRTNGYAYKFAEMAGATLDNQAVSGSTLVTGATQFTSICEQVTAYNGDADILLIAGGVNDYISKAQIGDYTDTATNKVYGSLRAMCEHIKTNMPDKKVIFISPIPVTRLDKWLKVNAPLNAYRKAVYEVATEYGHAVVNGATLGMPTVAGGWGNTMVDDTDGVHPTIAGHSLYARSLAGKLL